MGQNTRYHQNGVAGSANVFTVVVHGIAYSQGRELAKKEACTGKNNRYRLVSLLTGAILP
jgi:hypothetical protein